MTRSCLIRACSDATVVRLPFRVRVRGASEYGTAAHQHFAAQSPGRLHCSFWSARSSQDAEPVCIEPLAGGQAFSALLTHAHCFEAHSPERRARMIHFFLNVVARVPTLRLRFRPCLRELPNVVNAVEHAIATLESSAGLQMPECLTLMRLLSVFSVA